MVHSFWRFRWALRPFRWPLAVGSFLIIVVAAANVAAPWPLKVIVDNVLRNKPSGRFLTYLLGAGTNPLALFKIAIITLGAIVVIGALSDYLSSAILDGIGERVTSELRERVFAHLEQLPLSYHERQRVGDLTTRLTGDVDLVQEMLVGAFSVFAPNMLVLLGMLVVMFLAAPTFAWVALLISPALFLTVFTYIRRIKRAAKVARKKESEVASLASETLSSIRLVQAYTNEDRHLRRFRDRNQERLAAGLEVIDLQAKLSPVVDVIAAVGTVMVLWFGVHRVLAHHMSLGTLLVFLTYISRLYSPMRNLSKLSVVMTKGQASADRLDEILSIPTGALERADAVAAPRFAGNVRLEGVTFGYEPTTPVVEEVSLEAAPAEVVALTGLTGAGKSTLASLICRFYDPTEGRVLIDGQDVRTFTLASLRSQVSVVLQESMLFHGTILENIAYGNAAASREKILAAAEAAYVDEFVRDLPEGYDTLISERGTTLSGGQRQRIAIARALIRDAPIVIFDEPTSELDALSESTVLKGMERLMVGRTVLIITHRLSTLRRADRIYVISHGRVLESGTHDELVNFPGLYHRLFETQQTGRVSRNGDAAGPDEERTAIRLPEVPILIPNGNEALELRSQPS